MTHTSALHTRVHPSSVLSPIPVPRSGPNIVRMATVGLRANVRVPPGPATRKSLQALALLEHYGLQNQRVLVYDLVVVEDGVLEYVMFRTPMTVRVQPADAGDILRWEGTWLRPLWPAVPLGSLHQPGITGRIFIRGTELAVDRSMVKGSVVAKLPARHRSEPRVVETGWKRA